MIETKPGPNWFAKMLPMCLFVAASMTASCAGARHAARPTPEPALPARNEWQAADLIGPASDRDWWTDFDDNGLNRAIAEALENSKDLRAASALIEMARADAAIAGAPLLPTAELTFSRATQRQNFIGLPIPGYEDAILRSTSTNFVLRAGASWEPDFWGRIREGQFAALNDVRARYAELATARLSLTGQVSREWFSLAEGRRQVELARASRESFRLSAGRVEARFRAGLRPAADLQLIRAAVARAEAAVAVREEQVARSVRALETLLGRYPAGSFATTGNLPNLPGQVPGGLPAELIHRRPDLVRAEMAITSAYSRQIQSAKDLRPRFSLTSGSGASSAELLDLIDARRVIWNFVSSAVVPIFDNGRLRAAADRSASQTNVVVAQYEDVLLRAYSEVESALAADGLLAAREEAMSRAAKQASVAQELAEEQYRSGLDDVAAVLSARRTAYDSESQVLNVRRLRLDNRVLLHLALGGGFQINDIPSYEQIRQR